MIQKLAGFLFLGGVAASALDGPAVLTARCVSCHNTKFKQSGLDMSSRASLLQGGSRGPALVPGKSTDSLLYKVVARTAGPHMPFQLAKLEEKEIGVLAAWIDAGAPLDRALGATESMAHWAFQQPARAPLPAVRTAGWSRNPIDAFVAATQEKKGLTPVAPAAARVLARRVYLDLVGVPPSREELQAFLADRSPNAYEKLVDRLLDDPRYGQRWGRHWMDIWRYSDWYGWRKGNDVRNSSRFMWRWRDWIVESLNADKGYDRMIVEMLAGDEVAPEDPQVLRATGFLARNFSKYDQNGWMQDAVDHTAMGLLGITLKCARCHDHKFDAFSQKEYYQFRAFFEPYQVRVDRVPGQTDIDKDGVARVFDEDTKTPTYKLIGGDIQNPDKDHPLTPGVPAILGGAAPKIESVSLPVAAYYPDHRGFVHADLLTQARSEVSAAEEGLRKAREEFETGGKTRKLEDKMLLADKALTAARAAVPALEARIAADNAAHSVPPAPDAEALATTARKAERQAGILKAGENIYRAQLEFAEALSAPKPGEVADEKKIAAAQKRVDAAKTALTQAVEGYTPIGKVYADSSSGRRLALAQWIASSRNPLTARVAVNHIWLRHFGKALVPSVFDFGRNGRAPTHPALLDWLATELVSNGWSMKKLHRLMLTSNTYRMTSTAGEAGAVSAKLDPDNTYYWRMNPRRMEAEIVRDSVLAVAGQLDTTASGPEIDATGADQTARRSLYLQHTPDVPVQFLKTFDSANPAECYERNESVVPHQALAMANSQLSRKQAKALAARLAAEPQFIQSAFESILGRPPSAAELAEADRFFTGQDAAQARESLVHVLLNHNDFVTIR